jgi:hypothetical protein
MRAYASLFFLAATACLYLVPAAAHAQPPEPPQPPPPPPYMPAPAELPAPPSAMPMAGPAMPGDPGARDHDLVVGRFGLEARQLAVFQRTPGNDLTCTDCPIQINALSLRRWQTPTYAWSAGLALGLGGGSRSELGVKKTWDTYLGIGPTVAASFLLTSWKHLAVSLSPQLDFVFFMPRGSGSKHFVVNARGLVEGELQLGFIGLPELAVGLASGLEIAYRGVTRPELPGNAGGLATRWDIGFSGPQTLWGLVTNMFLRFYF